MTTYQDRLTLYKRVAETTETCSLGEKHKVELYARKFVRITDETWKCNNGYETCTLPVYEDAQGRKYRKYVSIDYYNNVWYLDQDGGGSWYTRMQGMPSAVKRVVGQT